MQKKRGISLIVLVLTIIIMVTLAGVVIITLNNTGVINNASDAVGMTDLATVKEIAEMGYGQAFAEGARDEETLTAGVMSMLEKNKINTEDYDIEVTIDGVSVYLKGFGPWKKEGFTVVRGDQVLEIGDIVHYDETAGGTITGLIATDWQVLGVDEDGNLLIISSIIKESQEFNDNYDWMHGKDILNSICEPYGFGKGTVGKARSIKVEDINAVTGYIPEKHYLSIGNEVTYSYNGTKKPNYTSAVESGTLSTEHNNGFMFFDGEKFTTIYDLTSGEIGKSFATVTNTFYQYSINSYVNSTDNQKVYSTLVPKKNFYWLASTETHAGNSSLSYGMLKVNLFGNVSSNILCMSWRDHNGDHTGGVRAVVTLSSDIQFNGSSTDGWSY